jgi:hypothetical protein
MKLEPILQDAGDLLVYEAAAEAAPVLQVHSLVCILPGFKVCEQLCALKHPGVPGVMGAMAARHVLC